LPKPQIAGAKGGISRDNRVVLWVAWSFIWA